MDKLTLKSTLARRHPFSPQNFQDQILLISYYNQEVGMRLLEQLSGQSRVCTTKQLRTLP
jgi:hypothetical protein